MGRQKTFAARYHDPMIDGLDSRLAAALSVARSMGDVTLQFLGADSLATDTKADGTIVTEADRAAETHGYDTITRAFPDDGLLGEEHGTHPGSSGWRWVLDPIDGTVAFARGVPLYGVLVGLEYNDTPVGGVIHMPAMRETVWGGQGQGAWHQHADAAPTIARVSTTDRLANAMVCTTSYDYFRDAGCAPLHERLCKGCGSTRGWSDCSAHLLLATGRIDAVVEPLLARWDISAVIAVIEAAGGRCSDFDGMNDPSSTNAIVSNGHLHDELLELIEAAN